MSSTSDQPAPTEPTDSILQNKALRRSWFCPGAGFALLGHDWLAVSTYLASLAALCAFVGLTLAPRVVLFWTTLGLFVVAAVLWAAELIAAKRLSPKSPKPAFLVTGFLTATAAQWVVAILALFLFFSRLGTLQMASNGMSPTIENGERLLFAKQVANDRLQRGALILYRVSNRSAWGEPGWLVVSRILAAPGDALSVRNGRYEIGGESGPALAGTGPYTPVLPVPAVPATLTVPENSFFVVQDSPGGYDSRVFSWIRTEDIVSTQLFYMSSRGVLKPVE